MKKKKETKKLVLNKISITQLDKNQINKIKSGGLPQPTGLTTCQLNLSCTTRE